MLLPPGNTVNLKIILGERVLAVPATTVYLGAKSIGE
jgi:hypothetical protein